jgi:phage/plasmid primase-like uncharacterized protein
LGVPEEYLRNKHGPCLACGGKDCFRFDHAKRGRGSFICSKASGKGGGAPLSGDGFALLMHVHGWTFSETRQRVIDASALQDDSGQISAPNVPARVTRPSNPLEWSDKAETIWRQTVPLRGTLGETYLQHRGCLLPPADSDLRFLGGTHKYPPSLCARVTDIGTAKPISLHFTRLAPDGRGKAGGERDKMLLGGHRKKGGCVRLWPNEAITNGLAITEGIESALAAAHIHTPVWAAIDAGNLCSFPVLPGVEALTIFADHDDAGLNAARACGARWKSAGREIQILRVRQSGEDVADVSGREMAA